MQAFILGAGLGTRLAPLTHILPKPLMPVFQKPLIQHTMEHYLRSGVTEFIVNISQLTLMWERAFPENNYRGVPVRFSHEEEPLDSGGGLKKIMPMVNPDEPLLVHNGDNVVAYRKGDAILIFNFDPSRSYQGYEVPMPDIGDYEVVMSTDDKAFGGFERVNHQVYIAKKMPDGRTGFQIYLPNRCAIVLKPVKKA